MRARTLDPSLVETVFVGTREDLETPVLVLVAFGFMAKNAGGMSPLLALYTRDWSYLGINVCGVGVNVFIHTGMTYINEGLALNRMIYV